MRNNITLFILLIVLSGTLTAQNIKKFDQIDSLFTNLYASGAFNGNVLIAEKGEIIYEKSFGLANEKTNQKLNSQSVFELASVSKQFTAMGIVLLQKQGKLSYSDEIVKYIPELHEFKGVTIFNLLTHTGGLPDYMEIADKTWDKGKIATNIDILNLFSEVKPKKLFEANEKWEYSNTGYLILASIIERVSGKPFGDFLKENIFNPLKMERTFVHRRRYEPKTIDNYAEGYYFSDSLKRKVLPDELSQYDYITFLDGIVGDGMVNSTSKDLLKWDRALYSNALIDEEDKKLIFSSHKTNHNKDTDYGFGWKIDSTHNNGKIVSHSGGWAGYVTYIERHIDNDKTVIILQNNDLEETRNPIKNLRKVIYGLPIEKRINLDESTLRKYAGKYIENGNESSIIFENGKLYAPRNERVKLELIPVSKTKFILDRFSPEVTYTFILDENDEVIEFRTQQLETGINRQVTRIK